MNIFKVLVAALFISISSLSYAACSQTGNELNGLVGLDSSNGLVYTNLSSNENQCSCTYARFNPVNTDTKMAMSVLLAAKLAEKKVRVDFKEDDNCNSAYRVYIQ